MAAARPSPPLMLEASVRAFIDEHMQTWLDNFVGRFASFERRFADLERRFDSMDRRLVVVEETLPTLARLDMAQQHSRAIEDILEKIGGEKGIDAQLADLDASIERIRSRIGGERGLESRLEQLEEAMPGKADAQFVERIHASLTGERGPQARIARLEHVVAEEVGNLADILGRKVGRDELYFEMMARHMIAPPKSPAAGRPRSGLTPRPLSSCR